MDLGEFEASLVYKMNSRRARTVNTEKPYLEKPKKKKERKKGGKVKLLFVEEPTSTQGNIC